MMSCDREDYERLKRGEGPRDPRAEQARADANVKAVMANYGSWEYMQAKTRQKEQEK